MNLLKNLLRRVWFVQRRRGLRSRILRTHGSSTDPEEASVIDFLRKHPTIPLPLGMRPPYAWADDYTPSQVIVERDPINGMLFVMHHNHPVYFPRSCDKAQVQESVAIGLMEQDVRSPHVYVTPDFKPDQNDVAVFIGASDGLFCMSVIESLSKAYLFEPSAEWHEPLHATFAPWGEKVEIVPKEVGSMDTTNQIRLDTFFKHLSPPNFIQVDVDGVEDEVLEGADSVLKNAIKLRLSICTYHKRMDFPKFEKLLSAMGYQIGNSPGFFLIGVRKPYFRRGILHAARGAK